MDDSETYVNLKFTRTDSPSPSRELRSQRIFHRTDDSETSGNEKFTKTDSRSPSRGLQEQESKENIGNRPYRKICLLCTVTSICFAIVTGLSIHVSQIRQSLITCERDHQEFWEQYQEMNRTQQECRLQITDIEIKYRTLTKAKAQICQLLTSRKGLWGERVNAISLLIEIGLSGESRLVVLVCGLHRKTASNVLYVTMSGKVECIECKSSSVGYPCNRKLHRFICEVAAPLYPDIPEEIQHLCQ
ncbi:uncharacterized protein [Mobula birostris]|uniref:uncharacterized protein n=1 Tax=Mobula birostris TaxID=1983395 RepID=UPI003B284101